jgi:hypothetical protein
MGIGFPRSGQRLTSIRIAFRSSTVCSRSTKWRPSVAKRKLMRCSYIKSAASFALPVTGTRDFQPGLQRALGESDQRTVSAVRVHWSERADFWLIVTFIGAKMRQQTRASKEPAEKVVQDIRRATRKHHSAEEKIRIVLEGLRGEDSIAESPRGDRAEPVLSPVEMSVVRDFGTGGGLI